MTNRAKMIRRMERRQEASRIILEASRPRPIQDMGEWWNSLDHAERAFLIKRHGKRFQAARRSAYELDASSGKPASPRNPLAEYLAMHCGTFERITGVSVDTLPATVD